MEFQFMLILGLLGMYFDAAVVFVTKSSLLFRLAVAILCGIIIHTYHIHSYKTCGYYFFVGSSTEVIIRT